MSTTTKDINKQCKRQSPEPEPEGMAHKGVAGLAGLETWVRPIKLPARGFAAAASSYSFLYRANGLKEMGSSTKTYVNDETNTGRALPPSPSPIPALNPFVVAGFSGQCQTILKLCGYLSSQPNCYCPYPHFNYPLAPPPQTLCRQTKRLERDFKKHLRKATKNGTYA